MTLLSDAEVSEQLPSGWVRSGTEIKLTTEHKDFASALAFVNVVGGLAESSNHHPDIQLHSWNKVDLTLSTHDEGGITSKDIQLASEINSLRAS